MPVSMNDVIVFLRADEPAYAEAARLGEDALPHLRELADSSDVELASKATSLAGFINAGGSAEVIEVASHHSNPAVRVAAAASLSQIPLSRVPIPALDRLLGDDDPGVRKWAVKAVEVHRIASLKTKIESIAQGDPSPGLRGMGADVLRLLQ